MKTFLLLLSLAITLVSSAQNTFVYDEYISINHEKGKIQIWDYYNDKLLCKAAPADELVTGVNHGLIGFKKGEKYGLLNIYGKIIVPATFDAFDNGEYGNPIATIDDCFGVRKGDKIGLIDSTGKFLVPLGYYDNMWNAKSGFGAADKDGLFGLFKSGKAVLPMEYTSLYDFGQRFEFYRETEVISKGELSGLINNKGVIVQTPKYVSIEDLEDAYWVMRDENSKDHLADYSGKEVSKNSYENIYGVEGSYLLVIEGNKYGVALFDGTIVCPIAYDNLGYQITSDHIFVQRNSKWGIYNLKTQKQLPLQYENEYSPVFLETGLAAVKINGLWGMVDSEGKLVHEPIFENEEQTLVFYNGFTVVARNKKTGVLNSNGKLILPCEYDNIYPSPYYDQIVKRNGKEGLISNKFEVLIPAEYDELGDKISDTKYFVKKGGKMGAYEIGKGLLIPTVYDEITMYKSADNNTYFQTIKDGKIGFWSLDGRLLLENTIDKVFKINMKGALVSSNGELKRFSMKNGEALPLTLDSIRKFETTSFIYHDLMWYCISNTDKKIIGKPYTLLGQFDAQGNVVAYPANEDYPVALNSKGEEIKPGFHLIANPLFDTVLDFNDQAEIENLLVKHQLVNPKASKPIQQQIEENLVLEIYTIEIYDDYGYEIVQTKYGLEVFYKKNYYGVDHTFPTEPMYEFTFSNQYSNWGPANKEGWRWATLKDSPSEDRLPYISQYTVLVNGEGKEVKRENYVPYNTLPFFEHTFNQDGLFQITEMGTIGLEMPESLPWDSLGRYKEVMDTIQAHFPTAKGLTTEQFIKEYRDSVYVRDFQSYTYVPEYEEITTFEYFFYKTTNAQIFNLPPPSEVKYRFVMAEPNKMKGGENLPDYCHKREVMVDGSAWTVETDIPYIQAIAMEDKTAFAFGEMRYFAFPKFNQYTTEGELTTKINYMWDNPDYQLIKADLEKSTLLKSLIELDIAKQAYVSSGNDTLDAFVSQHTSELELYAHPKNIGLAMENELLLEPVYLAIATDNSPIEKKGKSTFLVIDTLLQVWRYDLENRKLIQDNNTRLVGSTREGILTQNKKTKLYSFNNSGVTLESTFDEHILKVNLIPNINDIQQLEFIGHCDFSMPITTIYGEDSIRVLENGLVEFVYNSLCDTNVMGKYGRFKNGLELHAYKQVNQQEKLVYQYLPVEQYHFTASSIKMGLPLNDAHDNAYTIDETETGVRLKVGDRLLDLTEKEYLAARDIQPLTNGYGGIYRKGKFIPYQTLLPFPEKHAVYIHLNKDNYLIGDQKSVELVKLNDDQTLRKSGLFFTSGNDFNEKFENDFSVRYSIQDFVGY